MANSDTHPVHRFETWQVWPGSFDNPPLNGIYPLPQDIGLKIKRATPIVSMGSCFAREIKRRLIQRDYNYITEETHHPAAMHASAAWENGRRICVGGSPQNREPSRTPIEEP